MHVIIIYFPCVDAGSTIFLSGGDAKDATSQKQGGNTGKGSMVNKMHLNVSYVKM